MDQGRDYMKPFRNLKIAELLIILFIELIYLTILLESDTIRCSIFSNKILFSLNCMMWIGMLVALSSIFLDLFLLRSSVAQSQELSEAAYTDTMTGLPNRYSVDMMIKLHDNSEAIKQIGCAIVRISNLVEINNVAGHDAGDAIIQDFCNILDDVGNHYGFVGRNGGNEYLAIIEDCDDEKVTQFIADLYVELNLYNLGHPATPIAIEYNYALNAQENKEKMSELLTCAYRKLAEFTLT